jgi:hypothetical protein|tara:strand:- start:135 stop:341 length:207 start_codon:yes stop_codon:yes gene_type:complete
MKNTLLSIKKHLMYKYSLDDENSRNSKSTNINVLLNRVKLDQKRESRKKILFTAATSLGVVLFGVLIF